MLTREQVYEISRAIKGQRLPSFHLEEELIDYVSCEVDERVSGGERFDQALETVLKNLEPQRISKIPKSATSIQKPNSIDMLQNYLKIAFRNFSRHRANAVVNIMGLVLALVSVLTIALYIHYEFSYDTFYPETHRIFRVNGTSYMGDTPSSSNYVSPLLIDAMLEEIPEVEYAASRRSYFMRGPKQINGRQYFDVNIEYMKADFFKMFNLRTIEGSLEAAHSNPFGVMVSQSFANRVFGKSDVIGHKIETEVKGENVTFSIEGVFTDIPENSHLHERRALDVAASAETWEILGGFKGAWNSTHGPAYIKIQKGADPKDVESKISDLLIRRAGEDIFYRHYLQPVSDIHLNRLGLPTPSVGSLSQVITFALVGVLILIIACINYINLTTARVTIRMKELGVRKVLGANRTQFLFQFISEAFIINVLALVISVGLVSVVVNLVNRTFDLSLSMSALVDGLLILSLFAVLLIISIVCGGYPGLYLSRFASTNLLRSELKIGAQRFSLRKVLVILQFGISAAIIVCTIVIINQLNFLRNSDLGYDADRVVYVKITSSEVSSKGQQFKQAIQALPEVTSASLTAGSLAKGNFSGNGILVGNAKDHSMQRILPVDFEFKEMMSIEMVEGRWFDQKLATDMEEGFVVNEAFLKYFNIQEPIGLKMARNSQKGQIIGVTRDFHWKSKHSEIEPLVMFMHKGYTNRYSSIAIKLGPGSLVEAKKKIESAWVEIFEERPFEWEFLDEQLEYAYHKEKAFGDIFAGFSLVAIVISSLGLLGLVSFSIERRVKEIGVRKVLGASISSILLLVSRDFSRLVLIGMIISIPVAYLFMKRWLENFQYRIDVGYQPFVVAFFITIMIAWISVSYVSIKAARANPVDSLRTE